MEFKNIIKELRLRKGFTQTDLAATFNNRGRGNQNSNASIFDNETNKITGIYKLSARYINVRYFNRVIY